MTCIICKTGHTVPGTATVTVERDGSVVIIRGVPAEICDTCGEYYLDRPTADRVYQQADEAVRRRVEVEVVRYAA